MTRALVRSDDVPADLLTATRGPGRIRLAFVNVCRRRRQVYNVTCRVRTPPRLCNSRFFDVFQGDFAEEFKAIISDMKISDMMAPPSGPVESLHHHCRMCDIYMTRHLRKRYLRVVDAIIMHTNNNTKKN